MLGLRNRVGAIQKEAVQVLENGRPSLAKGHVSENFQVLAELHQGILGGYLTHGHVAAEMVKHVWDYMKQTKVAQGW